ncbi:cation-translocating P-type ATPase [Bacteriovorax sp. PP10]|uniref:Cation-translocating P-type ATPase n=1 Tax=Bacteriovorax antarcticus TaxID=3088717 RepID=A0ABU5VXW0_9BACT|nr:cation-translocating P-type ATPase [Bacteriovorax sp. PP10]MEA9357841.1 cation-translocating P-type ATPase [Bacteriovorax sp. PP10]
MKKTIKSFQFDLNDYEMKNQSNDLPFDLKSAKDFLSKGGLTTSEVLALKKIHGKNELRSQKPKRIYNYLLELFKDPMVYLLFICGCIYFFLGDHSEAAMLLAFFFLIIIITIFQEKKTGNAIEALKSISNPRALTLRDGQQKRIAGTDIVPGDIVYLNEGDYIPADSHLISSINVEVDESILTGESVPVKKEVAEELLSGTTIVNGHAIAIVHSIGQNTFLGRIGKIIDKDESNHSRLEIETSLLVKKLSFIALGLCALVIIIYSLSNHDWIKGPLLGISLAMAILPNELPAVLTIYFAMAAWRLSKYKVLTRKISSIENLGSINVLCVDKTGTLTMNKMAIQKIYSNDQTIDLSEHLETQLPEIFHEVLEYGILASRKDPFDPMEIAFSSTGNKYLKDTEHLHHDWDLEKEYPLTTQLLSVTHAWKGKDSNGFVIGVKGSPEAIIDLCHMNEGDKNKIQKLSDDMASNGLRILGVAKSYTPDKKLPAIQHDFEFKFLGLVGIADPIRPGIKESIAECKNAGIRVVMLTGDHPVTAKSIARQIGLHDPDNVITGVQLDKIPDTELCELIKNVSVFSRIMPEQKLRLVEIFKKNKDIVAMTGDGVNDAPALRSAHIGIAMGEKGTDVAREASDIVLLNDDFSSIVESIKCGRKVYLNIKNALIYLFSIHIPIAGMSVLPVIFNLPLVLLPAHIAFLHLIIEPASSIAFEGDDPPFDIMKQAPRPSDEILFNFDLWYASFMKGTILFLSLAVVYLISLWRHQGEADARTLVMTTLILSNTFLIFLNRGPNVSILNNLTKKPNKIVIWIIITSLLLLIAALYIPSARTLLSFSFMHPIDIAICILATLVSVGISELSIFIFARKKLVNQ